KALKKAVAEAEEKERAWKQVTLEAEEKEKARKQAILEAEEKEKARKQALEALALEAQARQQTRRALNTTADEVGGELLGRQTRLTDRHRAFLKKLLAYHEEFAAANASDPEVQQSRANGYFHVGRIRHRLSELKEAETAYRHAVELQKKLARLCWTSGSL